MILAKLVPAMVVIVMVAAVVTAQPTKSLLKTKPQTLKEKPTFQKVPTKHIPGKNTVKDIAEALPPSTSSSSSLSSSTTSVSYSVSSSSSSSSSSSRPTRPTYIDSGLFRHQVIQARANAKQTNDSTATDIEAQTETTPSTTTAAQDDTRAARLVSGADSHDYEGFFGLWEDLVPFAGELGLSGDRSGHRYSIGIRPPGH